MKKEIYLLGVGNYTEVIIELAQDCDYEVKGLYHYSSDRVGETVFGVEIIGTTENLLQQDITGKNFAVTMGDNKIRNDIASKLRDRGALTPNLIHPQAFISNSAILGQGCLIHLNTKISTKCVLGNDCILDFNCYMAHHSVLKDACYMSSFAMVGSYSVVGKRTLLGMNSLIMPLSITLGNDCLIAAKSNVTKSFPDNCVLVGNPARKTN
ncbi:acetyltransferase [Bizionia argentinensis JUB59]|uniref:Acetyltransferase n=1 Tax=Bizionia argentinensis JUB59 TaxID=1046627 RepID=G2EF50_9FLAO|nr:acetyltransferase (isoleucine patch superfamily) [Bizionia argentinensis]EGV42969.1 acetyltransferase [Bizionia argentinensis JUB59]